MRVVTRGDFCSHAAAPHCLGASLGLSHSWFKRVRLDCSLYRFVF